MEWAVAVLIVLAVVLLALMIYLTWFRGSARRSMLIRDVRRLQDEDADTDEVLRLTRMRNRHRERIATSQKAIDQLDAVADSRDAPPDDK